MTDFFQIVAGMALSHEWLVAANVILSVLLGLWIWRYRALRFRVRREQGSYDQLIENLSEGIYRSSPDGRQLMANRALVKLNGYENEADLLAAVGDIAREWYVDPQRRDEFKALMSRDGKVLDFISEVYRHKTRERIWVTESARIVRDPLTGKALYYEGSIREVTETVERLLHEEQFRKLMREVPGALFQFRMSGHQAEIVYVSQDFQSITGIAPNELAADWNTYTQLLTEQDRQIYADAFSTPGTPRPWDFEHRISMRSGEEKWVRVSATPEVIEGGVNWYGYMSDVTLRKSNELAVAKLAYFDTLTQLPNRRMFHERIGQALVDCRTANQRGALLFIDLDNFKTLNDTQGHDAGDEYLRQVAARLREVAEDALVARIGGDEFVILCPMAGPDDGRATLNGISMGNRAVAALRREFDLGPIRYRATASVGIVIFDGAENSADEILKRADIAMYQVKATGRDGIALFDPGTMLEESRRFRLLADLRQMLADGGDELVLHFQPQIAADGSVAGAEGLVRWNHPVQGTIYPDRFVPLAEQFGLICELTQVVMRRGLAALSRWGANPATDHLQLSLNVSPHSFSNGEFTQALATLLEEYGVDGRRLTLEVTEHVMAKDLDLIARRVAELKQLRVRLSLDDFGTGYSSLAYLKNLPFDELKIDGGFVREIENAESGRALVKTILAMASTLGMSAVAEHVETVRQEAFLRAHGCDVFQGYLYGKAMPEEEFLMLRRNLESADMAPRPLALNG